LRCWIKQYFLINLTQLNIGLYCQHTNRMNLYDVFVTTTLDIGRFIQRLFDLLFFISLTHGLMSLFNRIFCLFCLGTLMKRKFYQNNQYDQALISQYQTIELTIYL
jgi:hypothetical protein